MYFCAVYEHVTSSSHITNKFCTLHMTQKAKGKGWLILKYDPFSEKMPLVSI